MEYEKKIDVVIVSIFIAFLILLSIQLQSLQEDASVSVQYTNFYLSLRNITVMITTFASVWSLLKVVGDLNSRVEWLPQFGSIYSIDDKYHPFADISFGEKMIYFVSLVVITSVGLMLINSLSATTPGGIVFFPIPQVIGSSTYQISSAQNIYLSSIPPGIYEDLAYNLIIPSILLTFISLIAWKLGFDLDDKKTMIVIIIIACLISASGVSIWVIPGFASAHTVYSTSSPNFISVFIFGFMASFMNLTLGMFGSWMAHAVHNALITASIQYNIQYFGISFSVVNTSAQQSSALQAVLLPILIVFFISMAWYYNKIRRS